MKVENIAKTYNTLTKYIRDTIFCNNGENRIMYKVKNKFYFISEKDNTCKCVCEVDSSFLECMDTDLKENVIFSDFIHGDYDIEKQLKEHNSKHVFAIFDSIVAEIDRHDLLESSFFSFCIHQIEKENNIVYSESETDSSIDTNMQEAQETETDFNAENTESSIKDNEIDMQRLKQFNEYKEFKYLLKRIYSINYIIQNQREYIAKIEKQEVIKDKIKEAQNDLIYYKNRKQSFIERIQELSCNKAVMNYMLEILRTKTPLRHTFAPLPLYTERLKEQGYKEYELRNTTIYFSEKENSEYVIIDNCLNIECFDFNGIEIILEGNEKIDINLLENIKEYMRKNIIDIDKAEFEANTENKYINDMQSIIKEANITDKDTIEKIMCLKDDISKHVKLIESLHNEKEAKIEFEKIFKLHFIDIAMTYPQACNGIANNQILKEKLKEVIFEAIKQENTESIARKDFSNKSLQNTESKQELDLKAKKKSLLTFSMKDISLSHKQHKSLTDYKHIDSFNSVIEKRVIKAVIAKERSPPKAKAKSGAKRG